MRHELVVSKSSPLISLERIGRLDLFPKLFGEVIVPDAVVAETFGVRPRPAWLQERSVTRLHDRCLGDVSLGPGETEAISLALDIGVDWIVLDDEPTQQLAESLELPVIGTLGLLLLAKQERLIDSVRPLTDALLAVDFRVSQALLAFVLRQAGETK